MRENPKDLRAKKTLRAIRRALEELIETRDYGDFTVTELTDLAEINRKTFYLHYKSLDDAMDDLLEDIKNEIITKLSPHIEVHDTQECISVFYHYLYDSDKLRMKIFFDKSYEDVRNKVFTKVLRTNAIYYFRLHSPLRNMARVLMWNTFLIFEDWFKNEGSNQPTLDELVEYVYLYHAGGYRRVFNKAKEKIAE